MSAEQIDSLVQTIASLEQQLASAHQQLRVVKLCLQCAQFSPTRDLQPHGPSRVCQVCYDTLRVSYAKVSVVLGSMRVIVHERMARGQVCPFCNQSKKHTESCYLDIDSGSQILEEYRAIEQHRDMLLAEQDRTRAPAGPRPDVMRVRLKGRLHNNGHGA